MTTPNIRLMTLRKRAASAALPIYTAVFLFVQICFIPVGYSCPISINPSEITPSVKLNEASSMDFRHFWRLARLNPNILLTQSENHYIFTSTKEPDFLQIAERLPAGGFGRILRYRGWLESEKKYVDLEFVYQDVERSILILDYQNGRFFRMTFKKEKNHSKQWFPANENILSGELNASYAPALKIVMMQSMTGMIVPMIFRIHSQFDISLSLSDWFKDKVRGPPARGIKR